MPSVVESSTQFVQNLPGKRPSRRVCKDYVCVHKKISLRGGAGHAAHVLPYLVPVACNISPVCEPAKQVARRAKLPQAAQRKPLCYVTLEPTTSIGSTVRIQNAASDSSAFTGSMKYALQSPSSSLTAGCIPNPMDMLRAWFSMLL